MPRGSRAFIDLLEGLREVEDMQKINPESSGGPPSRFFASAARALNRASTVLISSHYEHYIYSLNEVICEDLNARRIVSEKIPPGIKITHSRYSIDSLSEMNWDRRESALAEYSAREAWLWTPGAIGSLNHERLLKWMKAPHNEDIVRYFRLWGIENIFEHCCKSKRIEGQIRMRIQEMVDKRNGIAHGDINKTSTSKTVKSYISCVKTFCLALDTKALELINNI